MAERVMNSVAKYTSRIPILQDVGKYRGGQEDTSMHSIWASFDGIRVEARFVSTISNNRSLFTGFRDEDSVSINLSDATLVPTRGNHGHRYIIGQADLSLGDFSAEQCVVVEDDFFARRVNAERWLDKLPSTDLAATADMTNSTSSSSVYHGSKEEGSISRRDDDTVLAGKTERSLFREVPGGPWELRKPAEVQAEAQRRKSSQSSWRSDEGPLDRQARFDDIDWAVVDELKKFSFTEPRRGRTCTRPDLPPWSPRAVACKLWSELPDFSIPLEPKDYFNLHVVSQPCPELTEETLPARDENSQVSGPTILTRWSRWAKAFVAASLASASAWYLPLHLNQSSTHSSLPVLPPTTGVSHPTGLPNPGAGIPHPPGTGISHPPGTPGSYPTGTGHPLPPTTLPIPPISTTTRYGPGSTTSTSTIVGTTTYVSTITKFVPCSTPVATAASSTYYSTYLTTSYSVSTITAVTTGYVVICPTPTPGSGTSGSGSSPISAPLDCPPAVTVTATQTIYLPAPSAPASHGGNGESSSSGSSGSHGGSHHPPVPGPSGNGNDNGSGGHAPPYPHHNGIIPDGHGPTATAGPT
ncbi:MAG: hypothetical protein Q9210_005365, partial [Variospora velana]